MKNYFNFGEILRELRLKKGLSQKQLGELLGIADSTVSKYETNPKAPDGDMIRKISDNLNVSCDFLLGKEPPGGITFFSLSNEQAAIIKDLVELFREQNKSIKNQLSSKQYEMLGRITENFVRDK